MRGSEDLREALHRAGFRWTVQRQAVAEALANARDHPTAEEIFAAVRRSHPGMSRATVYNTMEALAAIGRIEVLSSVKGSRRYDPNQEPHHHLHCMGCGRIVDLPAVAVPQLPGVPPSLADGFRVESYRIEYQGKCPACASAEGREKRRI